MYDPRIGRWLEEDPISFDARDANLYRYVRNSTPNFTDPEGTQPGPGICIYALDRPFTLEDAYPFNVKGRGFRVGKWNFKNIEFLLDGEKYKGDVTIEAFAIRGFRTENVMYSNKKGDFASFVFLEKKYTNLRIIKMGKEVPVESKTRGRYLLVVLPSVFIEPTIMEFSKKFKPSSYEKFDGEYRQGLLALPEGPF